MSGHLDFTKLPKREKLTYFGAKMTSQVNNLCQIEIEKNDYISEEEKIDDDDDEIVEKQERKTGSVVKIHRKSKSSFYGETILKTPLFI